jgi:hypothetical protein
MPGSLDLTVHLSTPGGQERTYTVPEPVLQVVLAWAGSAAETARLMKRNESGLRRMLQQYPVMREMIAYRYLMREQVAVEGAQGAIADRVGLQQLWTRVMYDEALPLQQRLAASALLAKSLGMFIERHEVTQTPIDDSVRRTIAERCELARVAAQIATPVSTTTAAEEVPAWMQ